MQRQNRSKRQKRSQTTPETGPTHKLRARDKTHIYATMAYYIRKTYFGENRHEDQGEGSRSRTLREFVTGREIDRKRACRKGPKGKKEFRNITNRKERKSSIRTVNDGWKEEDKVHKKKLRYE